MAGNDKSQVADERCATERVGEIRRPSFVYWSLCPIVPARIRCDSSVMKTRLRSRPILALCAPAIGLAGVLAASCGVTESSDNSAFLLVTLLAARGGQSASSTALPPLRLTTGQSASVVVGQTNFTSNSCNRGGTAGAATLCFPRGMRATQSQLFVADPGNNRVLGFGGVPASSAASADLVAGQSSFTATGSGSSAQQLNGPYDVGSGSSELAVADHANQRVPLYGSIPAASNPAAARALGAVTAAVAGGGSCTADQIIDPRAVTLVDGKVIVADRSGHRVLIWNSVPSSSGVAADLVLGQPNKTTCTSGHSPAAANSLSNPIGVWSDGTRLLVVDGANNRVLIWNTFPGTDGQAADVVLGQSSMSTRAGTITATGMNSPSGVFSNGTEVFVVDNASSRVLVWNSFPTSNGAAADAVLGQSNFTTGTANSGGIGAATLNGPFGVEQSGNKLLISDEDNHRVLIYQGN